MKKVKLFTHTDLDGSGCAIVACNVFGVDNVDITYCDYHNVNEKITNFFSNKEYLNFDKIFITDISVNVDTAHMIDHIEDMNVDEKVRLLDHHETANWLDQLPWATVIQKHSKNNLNTSGTSMLMDYLHDEGYEINPNLLHFVEDVRRYDTWDWANIYHDEEPKKLNDLFWLLGRERFVKKFRYHLLIFGYFLTEQDTTLLEIEQERINRKVAKALKQLTIKNVGRYNIGVVFAEDYQNEVAHQIHAEHPQLDLVAVVNMSSRKVSYRTDREDIDVGKFAQYYGGGGRPQTAGSQIDDAHFDAIMSFIFN